MFKQHNTVWYHGIYLVHTFFSTMKICDPTWTSLLSRHETHSSLSCGRISLLSQCLPYQGPSQIVPCGLGHRLITVNIVLWYMVKVSYQRADGQPAQDDLEPVWKRNGQR